MYGVRHLWVVATHKRVTAEHLALLTDGAWPIRLPEAAQRGASCTYEQCETTGVECQEG